MPSATFGRSFSSRTSDSKKHNMEAHTVIHELIEVRQRAVGFAEAHSAKELIGGNTPTALSNAAWLSENYLNNVTSIDKSKQYSTSKVKISFNY